MIRTRDVASPSPLTLQRPHITSSQSLPITATQPLVPFNASFLTGTNDIAPTTSKKRHYSEIIDLTIDDEDLNSSRPGERKKSRSSSHSTATSIESRTEKPESVDNVLSRSGDISPHSSLQSCVQFSSLALEPLTYKHSLNHKTLSSLF